MEITIKTAMCGQPQTVTTENCRSVCRVSNMLRFDTEKKGETNAYYFLSDNLAEKALGIIRSCLAERTRTLVIDEVNIHRHNVSGEEYYDIPAHLEWSASNIDQILFF